MTILNKRDGSDTEMRKVERNIPQRRNEGGRGTGMILTKMAGVDEEAGAGGKEYSFERAVSLFDRKTACQE